MNDRLRSLEEALQHYKQLQMIATAIGVLVSTLFVFIIIFDLRAIQLYREAVGQEIVTRNDLLRAIVPTYQGQMVLGLMILLLAWVWWATIRGAKKRLAALSSN